MKQSLLVVLAVACSSSNAPIDAGQDAQTPTDASSSPDVASEAAAADTWANWANASFFQVYCDACHMAGSSLEPSMPSNLYFTSQSNVVSNASVIRCGVCVTQDPSWGCPASPTAKQFPIGSGPLPSDADRNRVVAWITAGTP